MNSFERSELLLGAEGLERLALAHVGVFGIGGVGAFAAEALARSGVGALDLFDNDRVTQSNLNRQLIALHSTIGRKKVEVMAERIADINPHCIVRQHALFYDKETAGQIDLSGYDYIVDAIDTVSSKLELIVRAAQAGTPIISAMGAGNKLDPTSFEVADIAETSMCPLARVMRRELGKRGVKHLKTVYSKEPSRTPLYGRAQMDTTGRPVPGSVAFVPSVSGMILAGEVVKALALFDVRD